MQVGRTVKRQAQTAGQPPHRAIVWQSIAARTHSVESKSPLCVGHEPAAQVMFGLAVGILVFVPALTVGMPDVDLGVADRLPGCRGDAPGHCQGGTHPVAAKIGAMRQPGRIGPIERPCKRGRCCHRIAPRRAACNMIGKAEDIRQKHPFLPPCVGGIADIGQELQKLLELGLGWLQVVQDGEGVIQDHANRQTKPVRTRLLQPGAQLGGNSAFPNTGRTSIHHSSPSGPDVRTHMFKG